MAERTGRNGEMCLFSPRKLFVVALAVALLLLPACSKKPATTSQGDPTQSSSSLQQFGNVSASFLGLVTFESFGQTFTNPSEFGVPPIGIQWMGLIFNGTLAGAGFGKDITYQVHGSVSADGNWVESMFFSRQIVDSTGNSDFYRVTLRNVPLAQAVDSDKKAIASCQRNGSDVQRFLVKLEYSYGPAGATATQQPLNTLNYISTDWKSTECAALLKLTFATGPGTQIGDGPPPRQGMMG